MLGSTSLCPGPDSKEEAKGRRDGMGAMRGCDVTAAPGERHTDKSNSGLSMLAHSSVPFE